ncbi:CSS-motif domain-containing protein, partial [Kluyvera intermedia]|uniref:CSS-motif domain-containing protein n=1 Tax=Kluyvera intermedia TaxID=61648 RepID=UPI001F1AA865
MRTAILPVSFAVLIFIAGVAILNVQLWYSARLISSNGAMHTIKTIDAILDEARVATKTAMKIAYQGCSAENQYQLGTEAALKPHLRTIIILKEGKSWCSSLPGNRVLLYHPAMLPDERLLLLSAKETTNNLPVLIYQTLTPEGKIVVSVSDAHIRDALNSVIPDANYILLIDGKTLATSGDVSIGQFNEKTTGVMNSTRYPGDAANL